MKKKSVPVLASSISAACILLLAIPDIWPYAYYQILRFAVCGAALYNGYTAYATGKKMLIGIFAIIAVLFNPIAPIYLDKEVWIIIDSITAVIFIVSLFFLKQIENGHV